MWIIAAIEAFGALNLAPLAIGGASVMAMITGGIIFNEQRTKNAYATVEEEDY